jgi:NADH-quinone oxidoreductase subunit L
MAHEEHDDVEVGMPGPEHHIAERERPMAFAVGALALLALVGGVVGIPGLSDTLEHFLEPTFEDSAYVHDLPSDGAEWTGLIVGGVLSLVGVAAAWVLYVRRPGTTARMQERLRPLHTFLSRKWYFDEAYDAAFVRPGSRVGRFGRTVVESRLVQGVFVGGPGGLVRAGSAVARAVQSGYIRAYALLLLFGLSGLGLYFLIVSG